MHDPAEIDVLCRLLRDTEGGDADQVTSKTLAVAGQHGLLPLAAQRLTDTRGGAQDQGLFELVHWVNRTSAAAELLLNSTTRTLLDTLAEEKIDCLVLKGTALAHLHYPEPRLRPRTDVDLWIRPDQADHVIRVLGAQNYILANHDRRRLTSRQFQAKTEPVRGYPVTFDIHLAISNRAVFRDALSFDDVLKSAQALPTLNGDAPDDHQLLLHACLHRIAQGRNSQGDRLIWIYDIHLLFSALDEDARERFAQQAVDAGLGGTCAEGLLRSAEAFGTSLDPALLQRLGARATDEPATRLLNAGKWSWLWSDVRGEDGWSRRLRYLFEVLQNRSPFDRLTG